MEIRTSYTFDDLLIIPAYSDVLPKDADVKTRLSRNIFLNVPLVSSAMDTVTEYEMAIAMARQGGIGIIHRNLSVEDQAAQVVKVKRASSAFIDDPITISSDLSLQDINHLRKKHAISTFLVLEKGCRRLIGILTNRDTKKSDPQSKISDLMTKKLVTGKMGIDLEEAGRIMIANRIEKLPIVSEKGDLQGLFCLRDVDAMVDYPNSILDSEGRYLAGAAVGTSQKDYERIEALVDAKADVIVVDTAHGHHKRVFEMARYVKKKFPHVDVVGGNVASAEGAKFLVDAGVDAVKVGIGPGSICTTRIVAGVGVPQASAIMDVVSECSKKGVPVIADGGIKYSGDISKALGLGAGSVMIGSLFAGAEEAPGEIIFTKGKRYKSYRGMGSLGAMKEGSKDRYYQGDVDDNKLVPEGVEAGVEVAGHLSEIVFQLVGGLRSTMGYCGAKDMLDFQKKAKFVQITNAGLAESHVHGVTILRETPNYQK